MSLATTLTLTLALLGQAPFKEGTPKELTPEEEKKAAAERMEEMKQLATVYTFQRAKDSKPLELRSEPILRWNNPVSGVSDGTIFIWTIDGRPELAAQVFVNKELWMHEFISLSQDDLKGFQSDKPVWDGNESGITFKPIDKAPAPATTEVARARQMRTLSQEFTASVDFKINWRDENTSHYELRLMEKPVLRYKSKDVMDGGLFAFVQGTNPEVWLMLEARKTATGVQWEYCFARMTGYAVQGKHRGTEVFNLAAWKRQTPQKGMLFGQNYKP